MKRSGKGVSPVLMGSAPMLLVKDMVQAANYWRDQIGFKTSLHGDPPNFCYAERDAGRLMLVRASTPDRIIPNWKIQSKTADAYFWVDDAEALCQEVIARGAKIDWTLYETPWGTREFGIQDLDDHDIGFGQILK